MVKRGRSRLKSGGRYSGYDAGNDKEAKFKLNIGGYPGGPEGFKSVPDLADYGAESVEEVWSAYVFHQVPAKERGAWMDELWHVLIPNGKATIVTPYWTSLKAVADFRNEWPPISEMSYLYFNKEWREKNNINISMHCDFDFTYGYMYDQELATRAADVQAFWLKHYTNTAQELQVILTKRK